MSPRKRAQYLRIVQYVLLVGILLALLLTADLAQVQDKFLKWDTFTAVLPQAGGALLNTILYTACGFALGFVLALLLALMKLGTVAINRWVATIYIEFFRGIPALLVFIVVGFGLPYAYPDYEFLDIGKVTIALGVVSSAYMAETLRAGIQAVPKGQVEAARALGMSPAKTMVTIVLPQAIKIVLPPLANELIALTKDSSLIFVIGLSPGQEELAQFGRTANGTYKGFTPMIVVGLCYLVITIPLSLLQRRLERGGMPTVTSHHGGK
ncbi:amino acid ABC transporter permease [Pseudonocardiaceae bacterium YIM PH 21723]|nr:amino acid ABC transporter permease [Pseudonocardiaceae bacterium YIM PH 21723]